MKMYKDSGFDPNIRIINGDSEEAKEIYRELGWYDCAPKKDKRSYEDLPQLVLWALLVLLFTWISCTLLDEPTRIFVLTYLAWFSFFMYFKERGGFKSPSSS